MTRSLPIPPPDADSPVARLYREWIDLETRINNPMPDDERDAIVVGEMSELEDRLEAQPATNARDLAMKLYVLVEYYEGPLADEIESLITNGHLPNRPSQPVETDPMLELVRDYKATMRAYNASPDDLDDDENPTLPAFEANYNRLCTAPPNATTLNGAVEAVRLVLDEEEKCGNQPDLTINVLSAALAFFDGRVEP